MRFFQGDLWPKQTGLESEWRVTWTGADTLCSVLGNLWQLITFSEGPWTTLKHCGGHTILFYRSILVIRNSEGPGWRCKQNSSCFTLNHHVWKIVSFGPKCTGKTPVGTVESNPDKTTPWQFCTCSCSCLNTLNKWCWMLSQYVT